MNVVARPICTDCSHDHMDPKVQRLSRSGTFADQLDAIAGLQPGWNGYTAPAPEGRAVDNARAVLDAAMEAGFPPTRVGPSVMGGAALIFRREQRKVFVEFYNNGTVYAMFSDGRGMPSRCSPLSLAPDDLARFFAEACDFLDHATVDLREVTG